MAKYFTAGQDTHFNTMRRMRSACWTAKVTNTHSDMYRDADKSLARPTSRCILFGRENISFDASLVINIPPVMIINRIYETQNLLSL